LKPIIAGAIQFLPFTFQELWVMYGSGDRMRHISLHEIHANLGSLKAEALRGLCIHGVRHNILLLWLREEKGVERLDGSRRCDRCFLSDFEPSSHPA
jgi:hypothetical protein